jgi:hypothetical protein
MLGGVRSLVDWFASPSSAANGSGNADGSPPERADGETVDAAVTDRSESGRPVSSLYECPSCARVYVGVDKHTCEVCDISVEEVARVD